ncbi:MAG TPA: pyridoxal-dependent decarboxylase [Allosphingosinicella sp.]|nr:pyridoxal-dependent decarboxylase [Allosphingosinicella sp.]
MSLDPALWSDLEKLAVKIVKDAIAYTRDMRTRDVWREPPPDVRAALDVPLPLHGTPADQIYSDLKSLILPYSMGNTHPRFFGWYVGGGNFLGALGDFIAAIDGSSLGGGNFAATLVDQQVVGWLKAAVGFEQTSSSGTLTSGGATANLIGLAVARDFAAEMPTADRQAWPLAHFRFYASDQAHACVERALHILGVGPNALVKIESDTSFRMNAANVRIAIDSDRRAGLRPVCVIATAGTTSTGAVDDLRGISELCRQEGLWLHVDGCIGALLAIAPRAREIVAGLEMADSLAFDLHKLFQAPFEVGCLLTRNPSAHRQTLGIQSEYLQTSERGAAIEDYLFNYSLEVSRSFKALKIWMMMRHYGTLELGQMIDQRVSLARALSSFVDAEPLLESMAPTTLNVVCFRYRGGLAQEADIAEVNREIMFRVQESGRAVLTDTTLRGRYCLRAAVVNHRTDEVDLVALVQQILDIGRTVEASRGKG